MNNAEILIVGGGPAGLTAAGALKQAGLEATVLDGGERIGHSWERRYDRLHLHTVRAYSGLAHFPIPNTLPKYPSKDQYAGYLRDYAAHFELKVVSGTLVKRVRQTKGGGRLPWEVIQRTKPGPLGLLWLRPGTITGHFAPIGPVAEYRGETLHSSGFHTGRTFQNQQVLLIGAGNSGLEIAVDLVEGGAAGVAVSIRSGPSVVPRDFLGVPAQVFGILMSSLPPGFSDRLGAFLSRLALGDLQRYGFPSPSWRPFSSHRIPVIDVGFVSALKAGKISIRPAVRSFTPTGVVYQDDRQEVFDAVIFATGFHTGLSALLEPDGLLDAYGLPRFPSGAPTALPGLYFMGYYDSLRGFLYESNLASQRLAQEIKRNYPKAG